jgi:DNA ligase (NAD+)
MDFKSNPKTRFKNASKLDQDEARLQLDPLREGIEYHDYLCYAKNRPQVPDSTHDKLFRRLQELEQAFPDLATDDSPTKRVGVKPIGKLAKFRHASAMLGLNAAYEVSDIEESDDRVRRETKSRTVECVLEPKSDGLSVEVVYEDGAFTCRGGARRPGHFERQRQH